MTTLVPIKSVGSQEYSNSMEALDARETFVHIFLRNFEIPNKSSSNSKEINIQKIPQNYKKKELTPFSSMMSIINIGSGSSFSLLSPHSFAE